MAEGEGITKGIGGLLGKTTAGLPNWAWLLVIGGGIALAVLLPKLFGGGSSTDTTSTDGSTGLPPIYPVDGGYGGGGYGDGGTGGINPQPPLPPPLPPLPDCSLEHSCAQPPTNGVCPPGMHLAKDGLCRCNAKHMVNWGTVCLPPGQVPPGYAPNTVTNPPAATTTAVAGQEASMVAGNSKLEEQNNLHTMPPIKAKGSLPPVHGKPIIKGDNDDIHIMPPIKVTPRWPNKEEE